MYQIKLTKRAVRQLENLDNVTYLKVYNVLEKLKNNPRPVGCIKLTDSEAYRIRTGDYRIIYEIFDNILIVEIYQIVHRKDAYK